MKRFATIILIFTLSFSYCIAQSYSQIEFIHPAELIDDQDFGNTLAISDDYAFIGVMSDETNGAYSGACYVYEKNGNSWDFLQKIIPDDNEVIDEYGYAVSIHENIAVVSARWDSDAAYRAGAVYVYELTDGLWEQKQKIIPTNAHEDLFFGTSLDLDSEFLIVGAVQGLTMDVETGLAYIYKKVDGVWEFNALFNPVDGHAEDLFGHVVQISDKFAIIGAPQNDITYSGTNSDDSGAVYVYEYTDNGWDYIQKLNNPTFTDNDENYGYDISLYGKQMLIGIKTDDHDGDCLNCGLAQVLEFNGEVWEVVDTLTAPDFASSDQFGHQVELYGTTMVVSCPFDDDNGFNSGSIYIFNKNGNEYLYVDKIKPSNGGVGQFFGWGMAIHGNNLIVGSPGYNNWDNQGCAHVFQSNIVTITQQPESANADCLTTETSFSTDAISITNISYQWQYKLDEEYTNIIDDINFDGAQTPVLSISDDPEYYNYTYRCQLTNDEYTILSDSIKVIFEEDIEGPIIDCQNSVNVSPNNGENYIVDGTEFDPICTDYCGVESVSNDFNSLNTLSGETLYSGENSITWTAIDLNGNSSQCVSNITVDLANQNNHFGDNNIRIIQSYSDIEVLNAKGYYYNFSDSQGKILKSGEISENYQIIIIKNIPKGIYIFNIYNSKNRITQKIINIF